MLDKTKINMPLPAVEGALRRNGLTVKKNRLKGGKGFQLHLTAAGFEDVSINVYDSDAVVVQGKPGKARDAVFTLLLACMVMRDLKKKAEEKTDF